MAGSWKRTIAVSNQSRSRNANRHGFTMQAMGSTKSAVTSDVTIIIVATLKPSGQTPSIRSSRKHSPPRGRPCRKTITRQGEQTTMLASAVTMPLRKSGRTRMMEYIRSV